MYESEEIYYTGDYEDVGPAEHMDVDEQPIYYQDVSHPIDQPNMSMGEPGPSNYYQQQFDSRKPRIKRDYTEQKKQTVRLRKALDDGTLQRMTRSIHQIRPGQLGMVFRRLKKSGDILQQLPEKVQLEEIGPAALRDEQEEKLEDMRDDPEALYKLLSGLRLETGINQEIGEYDDEEMGTFNKRVIYSEIGKYKIREPGFDLRNVQGVTADHIKSKKNYQRAEEATEIRLMNRQIELDIKMFQFLKKRLNRTPRFIKKTIFEEPPYGCTDTCARVRPLIKYYPKPNFNRDITNDIENVDEDQRLVKNHPKFDPYSLENEVSSEILNAFEMHRRAMIHPALNKVTMNIRTLDRQRVGLEKEKPRTSLTNKFLKKDKTSKPEEPQTPIEPMKMVIKRIPSQIPGKKKIPTPFTSSNNYQISSKLQHPPAFPVIPKKKPRKLGPRSQYKDWD